MKKKLKRSIADSGIAFLDVISCGFGAVILLTVITKSAAVLEVNKSSGNDKEDLAKLQSELFSVQETVESLESQASELRKSLNFSSREISALEKIRQQAEKRLAETESSLGLEELKIEQAKVALQELTETQKRLLENSASALRDLAGGIPVDSEYIIFVIDTSGSMQEIWPWVIEMMDSILDIHPTVKGIQVMNDDGRYLFPDTAKKWIPDSPRSRESIRSQMRRFNSYTNSNPDEGIRDAIAAFREKDKKISLYVFGDDFRGYSVDDLVKNVEFLNSPNEEGEPRVRIHGIGFPASLVGMGGPDRFAALMRELSYRNEGAFVGLTGR